MKTEEALYGEIGGIRLRVDSREPNPPTLTDNLNAKELCRECKIKDICFCPCEDIAQYLRLYY